MSWAAAKNADLRLPGDGNANLTDGRSLIYLVFELLLSYIL